jgi:hypothetical protein
MTPRSTIESQNKIVFAVELGFTFYLSNWVPKNRKFERLTYLRRCPFLLDAEMRFADRLRAFLPAPAASAKP